MFSIKLYGKPRIMNEEQALSISLKKSEAVLYYLAFQGRATRDEIIDLIWDETDVAVAKKNLRNCLYRLKKDLGKDIFLTPGKNLLVLDETLVRVDASSDVTRDQDFLNTYKGGFLEGFALGDCPGFESWVRDVNQNLQSHYLTEGRLALKALMAGSDFEQALPIARTLLKIDPYNEQLTRETMALYADLKQYHQVIRLYEELKANLSEDLGVSPEKETLNAYFAILNARDQSKGEKPIFERAEEFERLLKAKENIFVIGEAGVGKTALMDAVTQALNARYQVVKVACYQMEMGFNLKVWDALLAYIYKAYQGKVKVSSRVLQVLARTFPSFLDQIEDVQMDILGALNFGYIEKVVCDLLDKASAISPLCIVIDDVQWMDDMSLKLLTSAMVKCPNIRWLGTMRNELNNAFDHFKKTVTSYKKLSMMPLSRFDEEAAYRFMDYLSDTPLNKESKAKIFQESEGNAFFIVELMRLTPDQWRDETLEDLIGARFIGLSTEAEKVMNLMVPFFDYVSYDMLRQVYSGDEEALLYAITEIKNKFIIEERIKDQSVVYVFTHHKLRAYLYDHMELVKRNILHQRITEAWLEKLDDFSGRGDVRIYQKLMYHYQASGDLVGQLTYYIKYLEIYFDFNHELYPDMLTQSLEAIDDQPDLSFNLLNQLIVKAEGQGLQIQHLKEKYHLMYGRYLIRQGYYDVGLKEIHLLIQSALLSKDEELLFKAYVQKVYHAIQVLDVESMAEMVKVMDALETNAKSKAIILRFKGIHAMMIKAYPLARSFFESSIKAFEDLGHPHKYRLNIAAAYNYISETYREEGLLGEALSCVDQAISICHEGKILRGLSIFNTQAGMIAYQMSDFDKAEDYLLESSKYYEQVDTLWRRSEHEAYLGLLAVKKGRLDKAESHLAKAKQFGITLKTPTTLKCIEYLEKEISKY